MIRKINRKIKIVIIGTFVLIGIFCTAVTVYSENTVKGISDNIIRMHIVAESDSDIDQEVKLKVRDEVMEYLSGRIDKEASAEEGAKQIKKEIPAIEEIAKSVLTENGHEAIAKAEYGNYPFPTKKYENIELPAGSYNALKITLGKGEGQNWWCVVFPPLCFADSANGKIDVEADKKLKESLSADQYNIITSTDEEENIPVRFKFKLVEMVEETKNALVGFFTGIFG